MSDNKPQYTHDSFTNLASGLGYGYGVNNTISQGYYQLNPTTRNRSQLELAYRGNWLAGMAIDAPSEDMTRRGIEIVSDVNPKRKQLLLKQLDRDMPSILDVVKWSMLFGGAVGVILIDGQDPLEPLDITTIPRGSYRGLMTFDRWQCYPDWSQVDFTYGPNYGRPYIYNIFGQLYGGGSSERVSGQPDDQWLKNNPPVLRVHHSRVIRMDGIRLPRYQQPTEQFWGESVLERVWDVMIQANTASAATANLVNRAVVRVLSIKELRSVLANDVARGVLQEQIALMRLTQANEGISIIDTDDAFENHSYSFSGLDSVLLSFLQQIAGAIQVPLVRLLGQSPAGLNSTGQSDLQNYYTGINRRQETMMRVPIEYLMKIYNRHLFGSNLAEDFDFEFRPLWDLDHKERAQLAREIGSTLIEVYRTGTISQQRFLQELKDSSQITGLFSTLGEDELFGASDTPTEVEQPTEIIETESEVTETNKPTITPGSQE